MRGQHLLENFSKRLAALSDVNVALANSASLDEMCRQAIVLGRQKLGFDRLGLWLIDPQDPDILQGTFGTHENGSIRDERSNRLSAKEDLIYRRLSEVRFATIHEEHQPLPRAR